MNRIGWAAFKYSVATAWVLQAQRLNRPLFILITHPIRVISGVVISLLCEALHRVARRAAAAERQRQSAQFQEELARQALRASEAIFHTFIEHVPAGAAMLDRDMRYLAISRRYRTDHHLPEGDLIGRSHYEVFPDLPEHWKRIHRRCLAGATERNEGEPFPRADGRVEWIRWEILPWRDAAGEIGGLILFSENITERKQEEEAMREREARFRTYAEAMPQAAFIADSEGNITYVNRNFYEYLGISGVLGKWDWKAAELVHPEDLQRSLEAWSRSLATGEPYEMVYRLRRFDGQYCWHLGRALPVRDSSGRILQWLGTNTDIHAQKETERQLERAVKARDEFLSIASHELKTPLTSLKLQAQILQRTFHRGAGIGLTADVARTMGEQTERQVSRLVRLVDDMLDISRLEAGKFRIQPELLDLRELLRGVVERLRPQMLAAGVEPRCDCPDAVEGAWDGFRMEQVVTNLLTNAMKYGDRKPVLIQLERRNEGLVRLIVQDQGKGISRENQERIFGRFERAVSGSEISGLGLGLYISSEIVKLHHGRIWVESGLGQGSKFIVELPTRVEVEVSRSA